MGEKDTRRGYIDTDVIEFSIKNIELLKKVQEEILWLIDRDYPIKNVVTFVGNRYMLSNRQRLALMRATSTTASIAERKRKEVSSCSRQIVRIDGFNLIITLEVALSGSTLIKCMDGTVRDLAGLRGTYRLIDKTDKAIALIGLKLKSMSSAGVVFYLDSPVSNAGRLKTRIYEILSGNEYGVSVELTNKVDSILKDKAYVVTSDAIILNECVSWINLAESIITGNIGSVKCIDLGS